ncbi:MAG: enolase C-terminal domain-like protein [Burkholderiaceae bacterium]
MECEPQSTLERAQALADGRLGNAQQAPRSDDVAGHADLRRRVRMPVALGESLSNRYEFWNFVREGAVDVLQPNPWKVGGITEWMRIASLAAVANLRVAPHASIEISAHLCAAVGPGLGVERLFGGDLSDLRVLRSSLHFEHGHAVLQDVPGHGVAFAWEQLAAHIVPAASGNGALRDE